MRPPVAAALVACLPLIACGGSGAASGSGSASLPDSGIRGRTVLAPVCPVERYPPDPACAPRPFSTTVYVLRASDRRRAARTRSGRDGRFRVRVRPGRYYVRGSDRRRSNTVLVTVHRHRFAWARVVFDTGIR